MPPARVLILMDCFCPYHGLYLARGAFAYPDTAVVFCLSDYLRAYLQATDPDDQWYHARLPDETNVEDWKAGLLGAEIVGVYCESDSGLADAERLRALLSTQCRDDPTIDEARRHKFLMNERVAEAGLATAEQRQCLSLKEAEDFAKDRIEQGGRVVVKPHRGVATESVFLCDSLESLATAWQSIIGSKIYGSAEDHDSVLVQEFLSGTEYAVDVVSRDGQHKIAAIWRYDKRPANGAPFCYYQTKLVDMESDPAVAAIAEYIGKTLSALGIKWGLSHNEVIVTEDRGPVLVEVNCRQHNMDFLPLTMNCIGYNALDMTLDALLGDQDDWDSYPDLPFLRATGCMVHLVSSAAGKLVKVNHFEDISQLESVRALEIYDQFTHEGEEIAPTIDIKTDAGWAHLIHEDPEELDRDYRQIVEWMPTLFDVEAEPVAVAVLQEEAQASQSE